MKKVLVMFAAVVFMSSVAVAEKMKCACTPEMQCACMSADSKDMTDMACKCTAMKKDVKKSDFIKEFKKCREQLNLTEDQAKAIDALDASHKEKQTAVKEKIKQLKSEKKAALENNDYDEAKAKIREMAVLDGDLKVNSLDYKKAVKEILTQEQKDKMKEICAQAKDKKEEMKEKKDVKEKKGKKNKKEKSK